MMLESLIEKWKLRLLLLAFALWCHQPIGFAQAPGADSNSAAEGVALLKQLLQESLDRLRTYEWTETTVVRQKGDEKARRLSRCHYRIDGKLQREVMSLAKPEKKKEEVSDYIERAITLVRYYAPPDLSEIQRIHNLGRTSILAIEPGKRMTVEFRDYRFQGDKLDVEIDLGEKRLSSLHVSSPLGEARDPVTLEVRFGVLPDGTAYPSEGILDAKAKKLTVTVRNSEYRKQSS